MTDNGPPAIPMTAKTPCPVCKHDDCHWPGRAPADSLVARLRDRSFEYLLNAMEAAGAAIDPSEHGYADKRKAVFAFVEQLQRERDAEITHRKQAVEYERAAEARLARIERAAAALVAKLDEVGPIVAGMTLRCHGLDGYKGPNYGEELETARDAIRAAKD